MQLEILAIMVIKYRELFNFCTFIACKESLPDWLTHSMIRRPPCACSGRSKIANNGFTCSCVDDVPTKPRADRLALLQPTSPVGRPSGGDSTGGQPAGRADRIGPAGDSWWLCPNATFSCWNNGSADTATAALEKEGGLQDCTDGVSWWRQMQDDTTRSPTCSDCEFKMRMKKKIATAARAGRTKRFVTCTNSVLGFVYRKPASNFCGCAVVLSVCHNCDSRFLWGY